jgi:FtsH-binding integral membrane protein
MKNPSLVAAILQNFQVVSMSSACLSIGVVMALVSSATLRHTFPLNMLMLGLHVFCQGITVGTFCSLVNPKNVCLGSLHTLSAFVAVTLYSLQKKPKWDLSGWVAGLIAASSSLMIGSLLSSYFGLPLGNNLFSGCLAVISVGLLTADVQRIVGGTHAKYQYGQREYILAALNMYQDALNLFFQIVHLLEAGNRRNTRDFDRQREEPRWQQHERRALGPPSEYSSFPFPGL